MAPDEGEAIRAMPCALELTGAIVTIDTGKEFKATAGAVIEAKADYVITVKSNRHGLHAALRELLDAAASGARGAPALQHKQKRETGHDRREVRAVRVAPASSLGEMSSYWPGLRAVVMVRRTRVHTRSGRVHSWVHYDRSSLALTVRAHARAIREHWGVEHGLPWVPDMPMSEDQCPSRDANGASNFAALRRFALTLFQRDKTVRQGTRGKQKEAGRNNDYLLHQFSPAMAEN